MKSHHDRLVCGGLRLPDVEVEAVLAHVRVGVPRVDQTRLKLGVDGLEARSRQVGGVVVRPRAVLGRRRQRLGRPEAQVPGGRTGERDAEEGVDLLVDGLLLVAADQPERGHVDFHRCRFTTPSTRYRGWVD